jgi:hypothetical protein
VEGDEIALRLGERPNRGGAQLQWQRSREALAKNYGKRMRAGSGSRVLSEDAQLGDAAHTGSVDFGPATFWILRQHRLRFSTQNRR